VNLILAGTCGEETGRLGANYFREFLIGRGVFVDELLVAEPTLCTPITAHKVRHTAVDYGCGLPLLHLVEVPYGTMQQPV
jgi:hypothetical protein